MRWPLIAKGANVNAKNDHESTPLHEAARTPLGHSVEERTDEDSIARKEAVELLLAKGADVNAKDNHGMTPLHCAADGIYNEVTKVLIYKDADINVVDKIRRTPLDYAIEHNHTEIADLLRKHGGKTGEELKAEGK